MNLNDVKSPGSALKKKWRVGRGPGSGNGKTAGRGMNGQGSRSGVGGGLGHEGGQMPIYRRLPKRGFTNAPFKVTYSIVNVKDLAAAFPQGGGIDLAKIKQAQLVKKNATLLKILGKGDIGVALQVKADRVSATARTKIEAAGGSVETAA
ncbi:MAG TPA: 50S ribosomal protein L15 [Planctomycetota bacterium]|nr:50S ribosomal protein L15 [Planctomycetota bacterium]